MLAKCQYTMRPGGIQCRSMLPDVRVRASVNLPARKKRMKTCSRQNSFRQIWPWYNWYPYWVYFHIFDHRIHHIVNVADL